MSRGRAVAGRGAGAARPGRAPRPDLAKRPVEVAAMFDQVAPRYDVTNRVLSLGQDARWRRLGADALELEPGRLVLDLAAGTGTSSVVLAASGARVVPCDFSVGMLRVGKRAVPELGFVAGDGTRLPFSDEAFDAVTIVFGLRNVADPDLCLREMHRVTRPGGRLVVVEFSRPTAAVLRVLYVEYLLRAFPPVARTFSSSPESYGYLAESIRAWPDQAELAARIAGAGWRRPQWRNLSAGIVALHRATA